MPAIKKKKEKPVKDVAVREIVYPEMQVDPAGLVLTREQMEQEILGWESESEDVKFGEDYLLIDEMGHKVRLTRNANNRPYHDSVSRGYSQDVLNKRWQFNGETMVIGEYGDVLSGQHRGIGFVLACQQWDGWKDGKQDEERKTHWQSIWPEEPTFHTLVVFGVKQNPETIRTIDNVRQRSEADVIYTSGLFDDLSPKDRDKASKIMAWAVKLLWARTGAGDDAYTSVRTRSEVMDFINRHAKMTEAIAHIIKEDAGKNKIANWIAPGTAAGLLYLMGSSASDGDKYHSKEAKDEEGLSWKHWSKAKEFWTLLAGKDKSIQVLNRAKRPIEGEPQNEHGGLTMSGFVFSESGVGGSAAEREGVIIKAWNEFVEGNNITPGSIKLEYDTPSWHSDGSLEFARLIEFPLIGGIDVTPPEEEEPTEEEVEAEKQRVKEEHLTAKQAEKDAKKAAATQPTPEPEVEEPKVSAGTPVNAMVEQLNSIQAKHPDTFLLIKGETTYRAFQEAAIQMAKILGLPKKKQPGGLVKCEFLHAELDDRLPKLHAEGLVVGVCEEIDGGSDYRVTILKKRLPKPIAKPISTATKAEPEPKEPEAAPAKPGKKEKKTGPKLKGGIG